MNLAIIPARGGSKRIPRKNIREFRGKPIIAWSIEAARASGCFEEVMVSTEDAEIAAVAQEAGAVVPFMRSARTATDHATTAEVLVEVLEGYRARHIEPELSCCIYPTAPFVSPQALREGRDLLLGNPALPGALSVTRFSYPIQRALRLGNGVISLMQPEHLLTRSQDLEPAYHDAGQFYWVRVSHFRKNPNLMAAGTAAVVLPEWQVQDIDNEDDWILAEMKHQLVTERSEKTA